MRIQSMGSQSMGRSMGSIGSIAVDHCLSMDTEQWVKRQLLQLDSEQLARLTRKESQREGWVDDILSQARTPDESVDEPLDTSRDDDLLSLDMDWLPVTPPLEMWECNGQQGGPFKLSPQRSRAGP